MLTYINIYIYKEEAIGGACSTYRIYK